MFRSRDWLALGGLLLATAGFVRLGQWQLHRSEVNRASERSFRDAATLPVIELPIVARDADELRYRRIRLQGEYEPGVQILLDNMIYAGQVGYQVLTPFRFARDRHVLVNRGWVAASPDRRELPSVAIGSGSVAIGGRIDRLPRVALELDAPPAPEHAALVVMSYPSIPDVETVLGYALEPYQVLLDPEETSGFMREWAPHSDLADRNIAYAVQWFGMAAVALGFAGVLLVRRVRKRSGVEA